MSEDQWQNRRQHPRVNYPCSITVWRGDGNEEVLFAQTSNISAGGACVYLTTKLLEKIPVELKLKYDDDKPTLNCKGKVVRVVEVPDENAPSKEYYRVAIQFEGITKEQEEAISEVVERLLKLEGEE